MPLPSRVNVEHVATDVAGKKHIPLTMDACFSRHKFGVNVTPGRHAELEVSVPSTNRGPPSVSLLSLCQVPVRNSSVLFWFNFRRFADINDQCPVSSLSIHSSMLPCCEIRSGYRAACRRQMNITSHHAWMPSLQNRLCIIKTIADLRQIPVEWSMSPA